jgi:ATP-dependent RNA helicase DeaD
VINYSIPRELDSYVHRIGRTARSGKSGVAMSLVTPANRRLIERIEAMTKSRMQQGKIPSSKEVGIKKVNLMLPKFIEQKKFARASELLSAEWAEALTTMSPDEIAGRFLSMMLPDLVAEPEKNQFQRDSFRDGDSRPQRQFDDQRGGRGGGGGGGYRGSRGGGDYNRSHEGPRGDRGDRGRDRGPQRAADRGPKPAWKTKKPDHKARS